MTPAVDSRHAGATMSDREFAQLQMNWESAKRERNKTDALALRKRINAEMKARGL